MVGNSLHQDNGLQALGLYQFTCILKGRDPLKPKVIVRFNFLNLPRVFPQTQAEAIKEEPGKLKKQVLVQYLPRLMLNLSFDRRV